MSSTSQIVVALDKKTYVECQLLQNLPTLLSWAHAHNELERSDFAGETTGTTMYWRIECSWHGFPSNSPEVTEFVAWLHWLDEHTDDEDDPIYGASRIGDTDDDHETWGSPYAFEIYREITISAPI